MEEPQLIPHRAGCLLSRGYSEIFCIYFFSANRKDLLPSKYKKSFLMVNIIVRNLPPVRETKTRSGDSGNLQWLSTYYVPGTILGTGEQTDFPQSESSSVRGPASLPP